MWQYSVPFTYEQKIMNKDIENFEDHIKFLKKNGYVLLNSIITETKINKFRDIFFNLFNAYSGFNLESDFDSPEFVEKIKEFRINDSRKLHGLFRTIKFTSAFTDLFNEKKLSLLASQMIDSNTSSLIISEHQFRIDEPHDELYTLDWHQDSPYYEQDDEGLNSIVINICVQQNTRDMGVPELVRKSHKRGRLPLGTIQRFGSEVEQLRVESKFLKKEDMVIVEPNIGDVVIYDMNLIHKSGFNYSNKARFSLVARAFNPLSPNFIPFYFNNKVLIK